MTMVYSYTNSVSIIFFRYCYKTYDILKFQLGQWEI